MENLGEAGDNLAKEFGRLENIANIGDIVLVAGYHGREFLVDSYSHEVHYQPDYTEEVILYDVSDVITGEYMLAYQEDISVIRRADSEDKTDINASPLDMDFGWLDFPDKGAGWEWIGEMEYVREEDAPVRSKEISKQERIDRLLMEISDYGELIRNFGDGDGDYQTKINKAKDRSRELTGGN